MKNTKKIAALLACVVLAAFSLTGCFGIAWDIVEDTTDLGEKIVEDITENIPSMDELDGMMEQNLAKENRELNSYPGREVTDVQINLRGAENVEVSYGEGDDFVFEYDPMNYAIAKEEADGVLTLIITSLTDRQEHYRAYVYLPRRISTELKVDSKGSGVVLTGLDMPIKLTTLEAGAAVNKCSGDLDLDIIDSGFAMEIAQAYQGSIQINCEGSGGAIGFPEGEPAGLDISIKAEGSAVAGHLGGKIFTAGREYSYQTGDKSAQITLNLKDSSLAIGEK